MPTLAEVVLKEYEDEIAVIKEAGSLWLSGICGALAMTFFWAIDLFFRDPWSKRDTAFAIILILLYPFANRAWERNKIATRMRHQREVRIETKLNVLLGLVQITQGYDDDQARV